MRDGTPPGDITFRRLRRDDFDHLSAWLDEPHVARWWPDAHDSGSLEAKYGPRIDGVIATEMYIVQLGSEPIGLIQRYRTEDHPDWRRTLGATSVDVEDTAGIDYLIGVEGLIGRGVGSEVIRKFSRLLFNDYGDVSSILVTPQQENVGSWRALEKAGYSRVWAGVLETDDPSDARPSFIYRADRA